MASYNSTVNSHFVCYLGNNSVVSWSTQVCWVDLCNPWPAARASYRGHVSLIIKVQAIVFTGLNSHSPCTHIYNCVQTLSLSAHANSSCFVRQNLLLQYYIKFVTSIYVILQCCPQKIIKIDKHRPSPCLATGGCGSGLILWDQCRSYIFCQSHLM